MRCKRFFALLLCLSLLCLPVSAAKEELTDALTDGDPDAWVRDELPALAGEGGEWYAIAFAQNGNSYTFAPYVDAVLHLDKYGNAVEQQRVALALLALDVDSPLIDEIASSTIGKQGVMSLVFGLHLLYNGAQSETHTAESLVQTLVERQNEDGGWSVSGTRSDADVTAMTLQALAPYADACGYAIERALTCLSEMQREDASFVSYGVSNAESCCQVIIALTALGIDPATDARFVKNGTTVTEALDRFCLADGTYAHIEGGARNKHACQQALLAFVALDRFAQGKSGLYVFDRRTEIPPETDVSSDTTTETPSVSFSESIKPSESVEDVSATDPAPNGMSPFRTAVLILAVIAGALSLAYLLLGKKK